MRNRYKNGKKFGQNKNVEYIQLQLINARTKLPLMTISNFMGIQSVIEFV